MTRGKDQDTEQEVPVPLRTQGTLWASDVLSAAGKAGARMSSLAKRFDKLCINNAIVGYSNINNMCILEIDKLLYMNFGKLFHEIIWHA